MVGLYEHGHCMRPRVADQQHSAMCMSACSCSKLHAQRADTGTAVQVTKSSDYRFAHRETGPRAACWRTAALRAAGDAVGLLPSAGVWAGSAAPLPPVPAKNRLHEMLSSKT